MGCAASIKFADLKNESLPEPEAPLPPDPRLPLDPWQKFYLEKSWKTVARNIDKAGMIMFVKLLRDYPEIQQKWPQLKHLTDEEVTKSVYLMNLATRIFDTLDHAIDSLGDLDYLIPLLKRLGQMHADMKIMDPEDIWKMERPFLESVRACLEDRFTYKYEEIYSKFIIFIIETVVIGFDPH
ncbi:uncharacterized protein LOC118405276 [Branchiostoma floridae]|uniref:Uncharacterized protein LOC118405276 n=2 Tax=Branchiostoma floridae TaxID=7739 RepID=A0A9J7HJB7_BRAFL|nr:uncharacterized protein LOC118405276 [Branchiostoma floridae]